MTTEEIEKVARIVSMADGGCPDCVHELVRELEKEFPAVEWKGLVGKYWNGELR